MKSSLGFSYVDNKISELNTVNQVSIFLYLSLKAAERDHEQLNLLLNPQMARALVEVLQAKQIQISTSYAKKEISYDDFEKLQFTMEKVKRVCVVQFCTQI